MSLPIASRTLTTTRLTDAEITLILNWLVANASGTTVNFVTGLGTIAPAFFAGLQSFLENRRSLMNDLSHVCAYPAAVETDEYGNASVISDNL